MAVVRNRPYSNYNFLVDLGTGNTDGPEAGFCEVILPTSTIDVIEYRSGNDKESEVHKIPGRAREGNVIFKRYVVGSLNFYQWWNDVRNGNVNSQRTVTVQLQSEDHTAVVMTWKFLRAWPTRWGFSPLVGEGQESLVEFLELAFERIEME